MYTIQHSIEIAASVATLRAALSTREGFRAWLVDDTQVDSAGRYIFSFGARAVTLTLDRADDHGIAMTCVGELDNADWLGTKLTILLTPLAAGKTRVELTHAGYPSNNECYARSVEGWAYFMKSLAEYATTGRGTPFFVQAAS